MASTEGGDISQDYPGYACIFQSKILSGSEETSSVSKRRRSTTRSLQGSKTSQRGRTHRFLRVLRKNSMTASVFDAHCRKNNGEFFIGICSQEACCTIWPASLLMRKTVTGKIGGFWPRIGVVSPSIAEIPVLI